MNIAVIGYGGVGKALIKLLDDKKVLLEKENLIINVKYIIEYYGGIYQKNGINLKELIEFTNNEKDITKYKSYGNENITIDTILENKDIDLAVLMTPTNKETGEPGVTIVKKLLNSGINVVISDKGPAMIAYKELNELAKQKKVQLCIGCTTGGALPTINGGLMDMAGAEIQSIEGVLNGTTNFIIKEMEDNQINYEDALKKAQQLGIAETNPALDVEGWDTAGKLLILTNVHMGLSKTLSDIYVEGITNITLKEINQAKLEGKKYKLVGKTIKQSNDYIMTVKLEKLGQEHMLYHVEGKNKAVRYVSDSLGDLVIIGGASGVTPAAASILRDIVNINRGYSFSR